MTNTSIEWTDSRWNPVRGCSRVSEGCRNCYAERQAARFSSPGEPFNGFVRWKSRVSGLQYEVRGAAGDADPVWTGRVELIPDKLDEPLRWRKPRRVFVNSMSDLFHESLSDEDIDQVFLVMIAARQHTFQVLTKRPERMRAYCSSPATAGRLAALMAKVLAACNSDLDVVVGAWHKDDDLDGVCFPNVWLGVSVEDQATADARIPLLLETPAAVRFVSAEPLLEPVNLRRFFAHSVHCERLPGPRMNGGDPCRCRFPSWVIVGGESGPGARPCDVSWIRSIVSQCKAASVPCFVKQVGANAWLEPGELAARRAQPDYVPLRHSKGGDPSEWPEDLRVREFPEGAP